MGKFDDFISSAPKHKQTPEGLLSIADGSGNIMSEERVPSGLQLDKYLAYLYPSLKGRGGFKVRYKETEQGVKVLIVFVLNANDTIYRIYALFYDKIESEE